MVSAVEPSRGMRSDAVEQRGEILPALPLGQDEMGRWRSVRMPRLTLDREQVQDVRGDLVTLPFRLRQRGSSKQGSGLSVQAGACSSASTLQRFNAAAGEQDGVFKLPRTS